jgi:hypothetical protein
VLVSKEDPDAMHFMETQSDYYQGPGATLKSKYNQHGEAIIKRNTDRIGRMEKHTKDSQETLNKINKSIKDESLYEGREWYKYEADMRKQMLDKEIADLNFNKADIENFNQKILLGNVHEERLLQENMVYASEQGATKIRYPTSETASKIQGYKKEIKSGDQNPEYYKAQERLSLAVRNGNKEEINKLQKIHDDILNTPYETYNKSHSTILKKYDKAPKMMKKILGQDAKIVTDSKGNTWYEINIPDKVKKGKFEIKALSTGAIGTGLYNQTEK